jgi:hypothetical protein
MYNYASPVNYQDQYGYCVWDGCLLEGVIAATILFFLAPKPLAPAETVQPLTPMPEPPPIVRQIDTLENPNASIGEKNKALAGLTFEAAKVSVVTNVATKTVQCAATAVGATANQISSLAQRGQAPMTAACADGDCTNEVKVGNKAIELTQHALQRMAERQISLTQVQQTINSGNSFQYYHEGIWKTGFYDPITKIFVGMTEKVTTVMYTNPGYIENLKNLTP